MRVDEALFPVAAGFADASRKSITAQVEKAFSIGIRAVSSQPWI